MNVTSNERNPVPRRHGRTQIAVVDILVAATTVFASEGFDAATVNRLAAVAGTTKPTLYKHFTDKQGLFNACLDRELRHAETFLFRAYDSATDLSNRSEIRAHVQAFFDYADQRPDGFRLMFDTGGPLGRHTEFIDTVVERNAIRICQTLVAAGHHDANARAREIAAYSVGACIYGARQSILTEEPGNDIRGRLASEFVFSGIVGAVAHLLEPKP